MTKDEPVLHDFDGHLQPEMFRLMRFGMPSRIWAGFLRSPELESFDDDDLTFCNRISGLIDAAVWGAENADFVLAVKAKLEEEEAARYDESGECIDTDEGQA